METTTTKSMIIGAKSDRVFQVCAELESLPSRLRNIRSVESTGERTARWVADIPGDGTVEWETELTRVENEQRIAWSSTEDSAIKTSGQITFNPMPHDQTELTLILKVVTNGEAAQNHKLESLIEENLRALKHSIETAK